ncbi:hypothetical protein BJ912DRAFT_934039, partial [Pholiota molesta]
TSDNFQETVTALSIRITTVDRCVCPLPPLQGESICASQWINIPQPGRHRSRNIFHTGEPTVVLTDPHRAFVDILSAEIESPPHTPALYRSAIADIATARDDDDGVSEAALIRIHCETPIGYTIQGWDPCSAYIWEGVEILLNSALLSRLLLDSKDMASEGRVNLTPDTVVTHDGLIPSLLATTIWRTGLSTCSCQFCLTNVEDDDADARDASLLRGADGLNDDDGDGNAAMRDPTGCGDVPPIRDGNARDEGERDKGSDADNGDDGATGDDEDADADCEDGNDAETEADDEDVDEGRMDDDDDDDESAPARDRRRIERRRKTMGGWVNHASRWWSSCSIRCDLRLFKFDFETALVIGPRYKGGTTLNLHRGGH